MTENGLLEVEVLEDASLGRNRSSSLDAGELGRTPGAFSGEEGAFGYGLQDAQYVEDEYDSQSSVSDSNDGADSHSSDPGEEDDVSQGSGSASGKDSEYLTA